MRISLISAHGERATLSKRFGSTLNLRRRINTRAALLRHLADITSTSLRYSLCCISQSLEKIGEAKCPSAVPNTATRT